MHHTRKVKTKSEQERRDKLAKKLREIRIKIRAGKEQRFWQLTTGLFTCRSCWMLVPSDTIKHRVCPACRSGGKERLFETIVNKLVAAGVDRYAAEWTMMKEVF